WTQTSPAASELNASDVELAVLRQAPPDHRLLSGRARRQCGNRQIAEFWPYLSSNGLVADHRLTSACRVPSGVADVNDFDWTQYWRDTAVDAIRSASENKRWIMDRHRGMDALSLTSSDALLTGSFEYCQRPLPRL